MTIKQNGDDFANIDAQVSSEGGSGNKITIDQLSGSNFVGEYSHNGAGAYQEGENNIMTIKQESGAKAGMTDYNTFPDIPPIEFFFAAILKEVRD